MRLEEFERSLHFLIFAIYFHTGILLGVLETALKGSMLSYFNVLMNADVRQQTHEERNSQYVKASVLKLK